MTPLRFREDLGRRYLSVAACASLFLDLHSFVPVLKTRWSYESNSPPLVISSTSHRSLILRRGFTGILFAAALSARNRSVRGSMFSFSCQLRISSLLSWLYGILGAFHYLRSSFPPFIPCLDSSLVTFHLGYCCRREICLIGVR